MVAEETAEQRKAFPNTDSIAVSVLVAISASHLINDMLQSLLPALYPLLKQNYNLSYTQIGLIQASYQMTGSLLQPLVGFYTDRHSRPYSLVVGMAFTLIGLVSVGYSANFSFLIISAIVLGIGSAIFHPESSRIVRLASGGRRGFAQSLFQVGGNSGSALGPLLASFIVQPNGQESVAWFCIIAFGAMTILLQVGRWYRKHLLIHFSNKSLIHVRDFSGAYIIACLVVLIVLTMSKFVYLSSIGNYYLFYLSDRFTVTEQNGQIFLFIFLAASAFGTFLGGPIGDRIGRKNLIWASIFGTLPFSLMLPHANLLWTVILAALAGLIISSAFSAIIVYAQELIPGRVGVISGFFFGFAFGFGGLAAALLGIVADITSIETVYKICAFLPVLGFFAVFLPDIRDRSINS